MFDNSAKIVIIVEIMLIIGTFFYFVQNLINF